MKNKNVFAEGNLNTLINTFNINIYKRNIYILIIFFTVELLCFIMNSVETFQKVKPWITLKAYLIGATPVGFVKMDTMNFCGH